MNIKINNTQQVPPIKCNYQYQWLFRQYFTSKKHSFICITMTYAKYLACFSLRCSCTLHTCAIGKYWSCHACCVHAVNVRWWLVGKWSCHINQSLARTQWECIGTPRVLLRNVTVIADMMWYLYVMGNVTLFAWFFSIFVWTHSTLEEI